MSQEPIKVEIFTIPQAACDSSKANWEQVAQMVVRQLGAKFSTRVVTHHIEFMSPEWFSHQKAQQLLESGEINFPFVLVDEDLVCAEKKINIPKINRRINQLLNI